MKVKNLFFAILFIATLCSIHYLSFSKEVLFASEKGSYTFFVGNKSSNATFYTCSAGEAKDSKVKTIATGESLFLDFDLVGKSCAIARAEEIIKEKKGVFLFLEKGEWGVSEYYYCKDIPYYCIVGGKKVNLQISYATTSVCIGSPMIFGGY